MREEEVGPEHRDGARGWPWGAQGCRERAALARTSRCQPGLWEIMVLGGQPGVLLLKVFDEGGPRSLQASTAHA